MSSHLAKHGFAVDTAETLTDAMLMVSADVYDAILLDLVLPDGNGARVLEELRRQNRASPVIIITSRGEIAERVNLLDLGADDYLVKPFDLDELAARIRAVSRRGSVQQEPLLVFSNLEFDRSNREMIVRGQRIGLRPREAALLEVLLRRAGTPVHREMLLSSLYSLDEEIGSNALDVHVHHLRRRLADAGAQVTIATVRGHGYALRGPVG
jgi:DNA-binding response OmpR family regulator